MAHKDYGTLSAQASTAVKEPLLRSTTLPADPHAGAVGVTADTHHKKHIHWHSRGLWQIPRLLK